MQDAWLLFPGQTLENTKVENRGKALIARPAAWKRITDNLDSKKVQQEAFDKELAHKQFLKDESQNMVKNWGNSIEQMREQRMEERQRKIIAHEEALYNRFLELSEEQAAERNIIVETAKKKLYMKQEPSIEINSGLYLTETLFERGIQRNFNEMERERLKNEAEKYSQLVRYNAEQERKENAEKKRKRKETNIKYCEDLKAQIKEKADALNKANEEKLQSEIEDNKRRAEEIRAIAGYEYLLNQQKKASMRKQVIDFQETKRQLDEEAKTQNELENKISDINNVAKCFIDERKLLRGTTVREELLRRSNIVYNNVVAENKAIEEQKERILAKQMEEYDKKQMEIIAQKEAHQKKLRDDRIEYHLQCVKRKEEEAAKQQERNKWDMANRMKTKEVQDKYNQDKAQRLFDEKIHYREQLNDQVIAEDTSKYDKQCKQAELQFFKDKLLDNDDKKFFSYANEMLDIAKSRGRNLEPIVKLVEKYKVDKNLVPKQKNLTHLKSQIPIGKELKYSEYIKHIF